MTIHLLFRMTIQVLGRNYERCDVIRIIGMWTVTHNAFGQKENGAKEVSFSGVILDFDLSISLYVIDLSGKCCTHITCIIW